MPVLEELGQLWEEVVSGDGGYFEVGNALLF